MAQAFRILPGRGSASLEMFTPSRRELGARDVRMRVHAVSLNFRDLMVAAGQYPLPSDAAIIPCSDGAGEVLAVGAEVSRFKAGNRVMASFFPDWVDGEITAGKTAASLGGTVNGMLSEEVVMPEHALVKIPAHLNYAEAATMPCAAVTAWNALFVTGGLKPGGDALLLGTGGVSIWGLQLAKAAGARPIITSSSDEKLQRAKVLGAQVVINYRNDPDWQNVVLSETGGRGVDVVVEVGGQGTAMRSLAATRMGGTMAIIGGLTGFGSALEPGAMIFGAKRACGIFVGSREMLEDVCRFVELSAIRPVIDRTFKFAKAAAAYADFEQSQHFGKIVITVV